MSTPPDHPPFLTAKPDIELWLASYCRIDGTYDINDKGHVTVTGSVGFKASKRDSVYDIRVRFTTVSGEFDCHDCPNLRSLQGAPDDVGADFSCTFCLSLNDLQGGPKTVGGTYYAGHCDLTSLRGAPTAVLNGGFHCEANRLTDLEGAPHIVNGIFDCTHCNKLETLYGAPGSEIVCNTLSPQSAETVKALLQRRARVVYRDGLGTAHWLLIVNDYHQSGDLLTAIAQFEDLFKVPYVSVQTDTSAELEIPSL